LLGEIRKKIASWLSQNRGLLWAVMSHKDTADTLLRNVDVTPQELLDVCDKLEDSLDGLKDMLKQLYLLLYEIEEELKKAVSQVVSERKTVPPMTVPQVLSQEVSVVQPTSPPPSPSAQKPQPQVVPQPREQPPFEPLPHSVVPQQPIAPQKTAPTKPSVMPVEPVSTTASAVQAKPKVIPIGRPDAAATNLTPPTFEVPIPTVAQNQPSVDTTQIRCNVLDELDKEAKHSVDTRSVRIEKPSKPGGLIEYMGLWDWFWRLKEEQQKEIVSILTDGTKVSQFDLFQREINVLKPSFASYCWQMANRLMHRDYDELATGLLIKGLTIVDSKHDKEMLHIMYAKYFYRRRHKIPNAYEACINHCDKAIKSFESDRETRPKPIAPFKLLTMIYEEKRDFKKLLEVCDRAIAVYEATPEADGFIRIRDVLKKRLGV